MAKFFSGLLVFLVFLSLSFFLTLQPKAPVPREPSSFAEVVKTIDQIKLDLKNPKVFNERTAASYINGLADRAYELTSSNFIPTGRTEEALFAKRADGVIQTLFEMRLTLAEKQRQFEKSSKWTESDKQKAIIAFRRAVLYLRYAEDFAIEWRDKQKPYQRNSWFFAGEGALTLVNPAMLVKISGIPKSDWQYEYKAGDIILVRGGSFLSASIARIGDMPTNMSHLAIIAETPEGDLRVVESLLEKSVTSYTLDEYLKLEALPRAALYRFHDEKISRAAGLAAWKIAEEAKKKPLPFDIAMEADDHSKAYCAEVALMAYATEKVAIPMYRTSFSQVSQTSFYKGMGFKALGTFAPADIDVDSRFTLVAEHRDLDMLADSRRFDVVASKLFEKFKEGFIYRADLLATGEALVGKALSQFGFLKDKVPNGISTKALMTLTTHRNLVEGLMRDLRVADQAKSAADGRPLAYRELEGLFEKICAGTCVEKKVVDAYKLEAAN